MRADRSVNSPVMIWIFGGEEEEEDEEDWEREWMCGGSFEGLRQKIVKVLGELLLLLLLDWRAVSRKMRPDGPFLGGYRVNN